MAERGVVALISPGRRIRANALAAMCVVVSCAILVAALWPFNPHPKNQVRWLRNENGVRFDETGIIVSASAFKVTSSRGEASSSLEVWLQPATDSGTNTILTFSTPESPEHLTLRQYIDGLLIQREIRDRQLHLGNTEIEIEHIFRRGKQAFITITSGSQGTAVYLDGALVGRFPHFGLASSDFAGQLVLGTSLVAYDTWSGQLRGVAIYNQELTAAQVLRHYATWTDDGRPEVVEKEGTVALYLFDEGVGGIVHNQVPSEPDLHIPRSYQLADKIFLEPPWKEFHPNRAYFENVLLNVAGFIPFGFFCCAYLSVARRANPAALTTVILGATVSLAIEILQGYLPTRSSGMTDIITNTLGTGVGAMLLYSCRAAGGDRLLMLSN